MSSRIYPSASALKRKIDETVNTIALFDAATVSDRETYSNLATTVASLTSKLSLKNKNIVAELQDNDCLERLLGKCRLGGRTIKKMGIGGALLGTNC